MLIRIKKNMESVVEIKLNSVIVIESLNKPNSTKRLYRDDIATNCNINSITHNYYSISNKVELINLLKALTKIPETLYPLIHIASHGDEEGLILKKDKITWEELKESILKLNISTKNNLILNIAACEGAYGIKLYDEERSPFHFMIGPLSKIYENDLERHMSNFYSFFLHKRNLVKAAKLMKEKNGGEKIPFFFDSCIFMHQRVWKEIVEGLNNGKARHEIIGHIKDFVPKEEVQKVKNKLINKDDLINLYKTHYLSMKDKYFLVDLYPELNSRFLNIETEFDLILKHK